jgi:ADP-heptose:LPS heptosyltransferase
MWTPDVPTGYEVRKCRSRVSSFLRGRGLDLSASKEKEKVIKSAIGIGKGSDIDIDLTSIGSLEIFNDNSFDYVFDAHQLGNYKATTATIAEWWRIIKPGGYLILYEQDKDFYPHVGTPGCSEYRKKDLIWEDVWDIIKTFGNGEVISSTRHNESNEFSWQLILRKTMAYANPKDYIVDVFDGQICFPRKKKTNKEALVIRYGAIGDAVLVSPVLKKLKEEGYWVVMNCSDYSAMMYKYNPNIDEFLIQTTATDVPYEQLLPYWEIISKDFEKVINLTQSIEGVLVKSEGSQEYDWPQAKRHAECNVNYQDRTMEISGYPDMKGCLPEMHFSDAEEELAKYAMKEKEDKFVILWSMSGSGFYKTYPWSEYVAMEFLNNHKDAIIITVGDELCRILEWQHPQTINKCGVWTIRQSCIMTKYANLVIGPDTGLLNAASCFDTPKIIMLSACSQENINKYWTNTIALEANDCECHPCHRLVHSNSCPKGTIQGIAPKCMEHIKPEKMLEAMEDFYQVWKSKRAFDLNQKRICAFTIADNELTHRLSRRVRNSFNKFHPDIPFIVFDCNDEKEIFGEVKDSACACKAFEIRPRLCEKLLKEYDCVIYLDADTVVTDRLDEFLIMDYDVAGSLNIGDIKYLNAGVSALTSLEFAKEWTELMYKPNQGGSNQVPFNQLANSGRYRLKIVDEKNVYYNERSRPYWKELRVDGDKLVCNNRIVKVLHWAGGVSRMEEKLSSKDFSDEVRKFLDCLTYTKDFTEIEGQEVSQWGNNVSYSCR